MMNHYMCDLNFLGTHIKASVLFLELGYDKMPSAHAATILVLFIKAIKVNKLHL
jgi:hypothetical protein